MNTIKLQHTRVFQSLWTSQKRINAFRGGARSSKTWSILQGIAIWLLTGRFGQRVIPRGNFSIVRETLPALRATAYKDFQEIIHQMGVYGNLEHKKTLLEFHYNGREVDFFSTDDINSSRLRGRQHTMFYANECNTIAREAFNQLILRLEYFCIIDYNPAGFENWVKNYIEDVRVPAGDCKLDISTYHDNIQNLPEEMISEIEGYKHTDFELYQVYALGKWVKSRSLVYSNIHPIKQMPLIYDSERFGIDFGFNDPTVLVRVLVQAKNLYIEQIFYKTKMGIQDMVDEIKMNNVGKIFCDHNPMLRQELKKYGINIRNAKKGKDSISQGISHIRGYKIHVLETSLETLNDFRKYKYQLDENNNPTDQILEGKWDHSPDAVRYALSWIKRGKISI